MLSPAGPGPPLLKQLLSLTVGLCKYTRGPALGASSVLLELLLDLLHGCLLLPRLTLWTPVRYTMAQLSWWELSTIQAGHILSSSCCRPYLGGLPRFQLSKMRDAMSFCTLILPLYYTILLFPTVFDAVSTVST